MTPTGQIQHLRVRSASIAITPRIRDAEYCAYSLPNVLIASPLHVPAGIRWWVGKKEGRASEERAIVPVNDAAEKPTGIACGEESEWETVCEGFPPELGREQVAVSENSSRQRLRLVGRPSASSARPFRGGCHEGRKQEGMEDTNCANGWDVKTLAEVRVSIDDRKGRTKGTVSDGRPVLDCTCLACI